MMESNRKLINHEKYGTLIDLFRNAVALWINVLFDMCDSSNISSSIFYFFVCFSEPPL